MARLGLGECWRCTFANDICKKKANTYRLNFPPGDELIVGDVRAVTIDQLPGHADLAWASFPCQDLSLAGAGAGLEGKHSGAFWPFWELIQKLNTEHRSPRIIVLENVVGAIKSNGGHAFQTILQACITEGYRVGVLVIDGVYFKPQSRPRIFIVCVKGIAIPHSLVATVPSGIWHRQLEEAFNTLSQPLKAGWIWWHLPVPPKRVESLSDVIEDEPIGIEWHKPEETAYLLSLMSKLHLSKLRNAQSLNRRIVGTVYRRMRTDKNGNKQQRAELRLDGISGCLRTPVGGSSRQTLLIIEGERIRSRLLSPREAANLMGLPEMYQLPAKYNDAYHLSGDGLVVPVVSWLEAHLLWPLAMAPLISTEAA